MLAIDVGNSRIVAALFAGDEIVETICLATRDAAQGLLALEPRLRSAAAQGAALASVRPQLAQSVAAEFAAAGLDLMVIDASCDFGLVNAYATPATLGIDRLVGAAAARHSHADRDLIVIDAGTATTVDYVTAAGEFLGGVITPGLLSAGDGLKSRAPLLPAVEIGPVETVIGRTTAEALLAGALVGHAAMLKGLVDFMACERQSEPLVMATGGCLAYLADWLPSDWIIDEQLTLKGIKVVYDLNRHRSCFGS